MDHRFRVAIFAHNEEQTIVPAMQSVLHSVAGDPGVDLKIYVLINGCRDRTAEVVANFQQQHPEVVPVHLEVADKCHAWNSYVYEHGDDSFCHFFMDGDVRCAGDSLVRMKEALTNNPSAQAVAGMPQSGRNRRLYQSLIRQHRWVFGNLYGVRGTHLATIRRCGIRLPVGLRGNDDVITRLLSSEISIDEPTTDAVVDPQRVVFSDEAGYEFDSLQPYRWRDVVIYWKRMITYRHRELQLEHIWDTPVNRLPDTMDPINRKILAALCERRLLSDPFAWLVRRRLARMYPSAEAAYYEAMLDSSGAKRAPTESPMVS